jgi:hypothetical protein
MIGSGTASATRAQDNICMKHLPIFLKQELQIGQKMRLKIRKNHNTDYKQNPNNVFNNYIFKPHGPMSSGNLKTLDDR